MIGDVRQAVAEQGGDEAAVTFARRANRAHAIAVTMLIALGFLQALWYRRTLNPDGVAYLDLSDEVLAGHWRALVQAYWSPLYPMLLAAGRALAGKDALHETTIAHGVNFLGYVLALVGWQRLLRQLGRRGTGVPAFDTPLGIAAGYAVFAWAMLWLTSLHFVTPDLWLTGWIFLSAALVLRHSRACLSRHSLALGAALGVGYLTKSVLLPVSPFIIAGAVLLTPAAQRMRVAVRACAALALVSVPWIVAISSHSGRATFGDNGRFNYAWFVSGDRWLSPDPVRETGPGAAVFPRVLEHPAVYTWPDKSGTYAPWRDPSAWHGAMTVTTDAARQRRVLERSWSTLAFWLLPWGVVLVVLLVAGASPARDALGGGVAIALAAVVAIAGYALVFVEGRYVAPFLALLIVMVAGTLRVSAEHARRVVLAVALGALLWVAIGVPIPRPFELAMGLLLYLLLVVRGAAPRSPAVFAAVAMLTVGASHVLVRAAADTAQLVAGKAAVDGALRVRAALETEHAPKGRRIAVIGDGPSCAVWARQLRDTIVAELPASQAAEFWAASDSTRTAIIDVLRAAGATEIVAEGALPAQLPPSWRRLPNSGVARYAFGAR